MKRILMSGVVMLAFCLASGRAAKADNLHLCDVNAVCDSGNAVQIYSSTTTVFASGKSYANSTLFLAVLTPVGDNSGKFDTGTTFWGALNVNSSNNYPNLASTISQEQIATGIVAGSFNVKSMSLGAWNGSATITLPGGQPEGTIYVAYVLDANGNLLSVTPWSSSAINVPEPSSMVLLGVGLLGFLGLTGRKLITS